MATESLSQLLTSHFASLSVPLSDSDLRVFAHLVGSSTLLDALDLIDQDQIARITLPSTRCLYLVTGSKQASYTVHPDLPNSLGYCPCPAFSYTVVRYDQGVICKHLLAVKLAQHLDRFTDKQMGLKWLAGFATRFASVAAAQPAAVVPPGT